jgi:hypothetical protein
VRGKTKKRPVGRFKNVGGSGELDSPHPSNLVLAYGLRPHRRNPHFGGGGEIRTHGWLAPSPVFKTGALNRSATPPRREL